MFKNELKANGKKYKRYRACSKKVGLVVMNSRLCIVSIPNAFAFCQ